MDISNILLNRVVDKECSIEQNFINNLLENIFLNKSLDRIIRWK